MGTTPAQAMPQAMPLQAALHLRHKGLYPSPAKEVSILDVSLSIPRLQDPPKSCN